MVASSFERAAVGTAGVLALVTLVVLAGQRVSPESQAPPSGPMGFFIANGDRRSGYLPADRELAEWAFDAWQRHASGAIAWQSSPEPDARVRLYWAPADDSTFGEMRPLVVHGQSGAAVFVRADMDALGTEISLRARRDNLWRDSIVYLTCLHELGHALGLTHTADMRDIMYFFGYGGDIIDYFSRYHRQLHSREDIRSVSGLSDGDIARLRALHKN